MIIVIKLNLTCVRYVSNELFTSKMFTNELFTNELFTNIFA